MGRKNELGIRKEDYDTPQEYNRARMRVVIKMKAHELQVQRWGHIMQFIDKCENNGLSRKDMCEELANTSPYILAKPNKKKS